MSVSGVLYLVATPIGNLGDITFRAVQTLREVDFVICEDSRRSGMLLKHFEIKKPLRSFHDHSSKSKQESVIHELKEGRRAAYITDAGTPLISDPGFTLVRDALEAGIRIESIPGPSAFVNALVISGLPTHSFAFIGYLPQKEKARRDALHELQDEPRTLIFYESPYRLLRTLEDMRDIFGDREASVSREMTKKFEETVRGNLSEISAYFEKRKILGEWVIVIAGKAHNFVGSKRRPSVGFEL
ncbi:MAG: 16S rRNA (cytidine(1402)-2'-O)-methyltransferase [Candidatus Omnitrophica bacterium]|nr:16S rRNA (cytidine(1402)-2'-O)-methyltransferase [Candidatus Omnitrophota bacterium]